MNNSYKTGKKDGAGVQARTESRPSGTDLPKSKIFDYDAYKDKDNQPKRAPMTHEQLVQGIIFSEIIGPPMSKRRRSGR